MARTKVIIKSNFHRAKEGAKAGMEAAVNSWIEATENAAKENLTRQESNRGYFLDTMYEEIDGHHLGGDLRARVVSGPFYARFFEYGTVHIDPMPFLRPAKAKGDKAFLATANVSVETAIKLRASVRY
jgi:hypothetical protein